MEALYISFVAVASFLVLCGWLRYVLLAREIKAWEVLPLIPWAGASGLGVTVVPYAGTFPFNYGSIDPFLYTLSVITLVALLGVVCVLLYNLPVIARR
jgi:hypothetical protein